MSCDDDYFYPDEDKPEEETYEPITTIKEDEPDIEQPKQHPKKRKPKVMPEGLSIVEQWCWLYDMTLVDVFSLTDIPITRLEQLSKQPEIATNEEVRKLRLFTGIKLRR